MKPECAEIKKLLSAFLDGELSPAEEALLKPHAALCPDCAGKLAALKFAKTAFRSAMPEDSPAGFKLRPEAVYRTNLHRLPAAWKPAFAAIAFGLIFWIAGKLPDLKSSQKPRPAVWQVQAQELGIQEVL